MVAAIVLSWLASASTVAAQQRADPLISSTDDPLLLQQYAVEYYRRDQPRLALQALSKSLSIYPRNAETHMWMGAVHLHMQDFAKAEASFGKALEINPGLTDVHNWLGVYWSRRGDRERAVDHYRRALADPAYPRISRSRVQFNLGRVLAEMGRYEDAIPYLSDASRGPVPSNDAAFRWIRLQLAEALLFTGRPQEALAVLADLDVLPDSPEAELLTGMAYRDLGEAGSARDHLQRVLRLAPGTTESERALEILRELHPEGHS